MKVLFCGGSEKSGSWQMRGVQIAAGGGWEAVNSPSLAQIKAADIIVAVKRVKGNLADMIRGSGKPVIWDALDFWKQPEESEIDTLEKALHITQPHIDKLKPSVILCANQQMADDLGGVCIYHHARINAVVGFGKDIVYDGHPRYADGLTVNACKIGWRYRAGWPDKDTGALLSVRMGKDGGWLARRWKSNVKAANAIACGVPFIAEPDQAYLETVPDNMALWFETQEELDEKIVRLADQRFIQGARRAADTEHHKTTIRQAVSEYQKLFRQL